MDRLSPNTRPSITRQKNIYLLTVKGPSRCRLNWFRFILDWHLTRNLIEFFFDEFTCEPCKHIGFFDEVFQVKELFCNVKIQDGLWEFCGRGNWDLIFYLQHFCYLWNPQKNRMEILETWPIKEWSLRVIGNLLREIPQTFWLLSKFQDLCL